MEVSKLPYRAEYAKSGRAGCKKCKEPIVKDTLRLAVMVQSPFFDGMQPNWHHFSCFFGRFRPKDVTDIAHFESLRWNDQELIRKELNNQLKDSTSTSTGGKSSKSKKRCNAEANEVPDLADYTVCYAKSNRSKCKVCENFINKDEVRISKKDYENEIALQHGPTERWHHVDCFIKAREELNFFASAEILPGFKTLSSEDQAMLKSKIPKIIRNDTTDGPSPPKRSKGEEISKSKQKKQNEQMFYYHDNLEALTKQDLISLFEYNDQDVPEGLSRMLERLSDAMAFGALKRCKTCNGQLTFCSGVGYQCLGNISEWSKCQTVYTDPPRVVFKIPADLKEDHSFLKKYKGKVSKRLFVEVASPQKPNNSGTTSPKKSILDSLKFFIHKTENKTSEDIIKQIEKLGGTVVKKWEENVFAVVSTEGENRKKHLKVKKDV